ncbi:nuclear transport factor 2 family protein [Paraburkholderia sp. JHI869]|uniref:nuclear transport factor 2 family protein n=1 Tax=Paraburkholderia sp. JHI869 TaxID=3112959 RepID=UPI003174CB29
MGHSNAELIFRFYEAFQRQDIDAMLACYADDLVFCDPAFGELRGEAARDMWRMLVERALDFSLTFGDVGANGQTGSAKWVARYKFGPTGRTVVNRIEARFEFRDGLIARHRDSFDLWRWASQALGLKGTVLGWTPFVQRAIRAQARKSLEGFRARRG